MRKKAAGKKSNFGADLIKGMKLVAAQQRGEIELEQVWPKPIDVKAIRERVKESQQGGRQPDSAARAYLMVIPKA